MRGYSLWLGLLFVTNCTFGFELNTFRIPKHTVSSLTARVSGQFYRNGFTDENSSNRDLDLYGSSVFSGYYLYDSENLGLEGAVSSRLSGTISGRESRGPYDSWYSNYDGNSKYANEQYSGQLLGEYFPTELPVGVLWRGRGSARISQSWSHSDFTRDDTASTVEAYYDATQVGFQYETSGEAGFGWGRMRDLSGAYQAHVVEQRLRDIGVITSELSAQTRQKLGEMFYKQNDYSVKWERNEKYFWREVEEILKSDPAMTGELDAYATYRISETIAPSSIFRWGGVRLSMTIGGTHSNYIYRSHSERREHTVTDSGAVDSLEITSLDEIRHTERMYFGPQIEVNLPLSWTAQFSGTSALTHYVDPANDGFYWSNAVRIEYAMHDKWSASYGFYFSRYVNDPKDRTKYNGQSWDVGHTLGLLYYIEDRTQVSFALFQDQGYAWEYLPSNLEIPRYKRHRNNFSGSIGFVYHFKGYLSDYPSYVFPRSRERTGEWAFPNYWYY